MRTALTGDIHVCGKRLADCNAQLAAMVDQCAARKVEALYIGGDLFDRSSVGDNTASTGAVAAVPIRHIRALTEAGIRVVMIPGNHDMPGVGSADALHVFDGMAGVEVIRENTARADGVFIPWSWDPTRPIEETFPPMPADAPAVLLGHLELVGAKMTGATCCEKKPGKWQVAREFLKALPIKHFALFHFHARQEVSTGRGGYIGALMQQGFGEEGNPAGFEIYDTDTGAVEWVELDAAPRYRTVKSESANVKITPNANEHLRVIFTGDTAPSPEAIRRMESDGIRVEQVVAQEERVRRAEVPAGIADNPHGLIDLWTGTQNPVFERPRVDRMRRTFDLVTADAGGGR
jgi:DNA repair exonuclease SbcCD nuclease subunit